MVHFFCREGKIRQACNGLLWLLWKIIVRKRGLESISCVAGSHCKRLQKTSITSEPSVVVWLLRLWGGWGKYFQLTQMLISLWSQCDGDDNDWNVTERKTKSRWSRLFSMYFQCLTEWVWYCTFYFSVEFQDGVSDMSLQSLVWKHDFCLDGRNEFVQLEASCSDQWR